MIKKQSFANSITSLHFVIFYIALHFQVAVPDLVEAAKNADMLVFVVPHQFVQGFCKTLAGKIKQTAIGISLIKVHILFSHDALKRFFCFLMFYFYLKFNTLSFLNAYLFHSS